jgi:hypothetical protein
MGTQGRRDTAMAKLTSDVQAFVVQQLACFLTPSEVAAAVAEEFSVEIGRQQAWKYHPANNPELAPKWRAIFEATREAFVRETAQIGIAHRSYRLRRLESYLHRAEAKSNDVLAAQILRQAAEEMGGAYSGRREITGRDGAQLGPAVVLYLPDNGRGRDLSGSGPPAGGPATTESSGNRESIER